MTKEPDSPSPALNPHYLLTESTKAWHIWLTPAKSKNMIMYNFILFLVWDKTESLGL
jgi:hypothetical protein